MAQVSKRVVSDKVWEKMFGVMGDIFFGNVGGGGAQILINGLMSDTEKRVMAKRVMANVLFLSDWPVQVVADVLKLSRSTAYGYWQLFLVDAGFRKVLKKVFPKKIKFVKEKVTKHNLVEGLAEFIEDIYIGRHYRERLRIGRMK